MDIESASLERQSQGSLIIHVDVSRDG